MNPRKRRLAKRRRAAAQRPRYIAVACDWIRHDPREGLASEADNYDVFCERCQRVHRHFTFTKEDLDCVISEGAKKLAEAIDAELAERVYADISSGVGYTRLASDASQEKGCSLRWLSDKIYRDRNSVV